MKKRTIIVISLIILFFISLFVYFFWNYFEKNKKDISQVTISQDKYLVSSYALKIYENTFSYIEENIDLNTLKENETLKISSNQLVEQVEKYKYCSGDLYITKLENNIYEYNITSNCSNAMKEAIGLNIKVYSNINQDSNYQVVTSISKTKEGYTGVLSNYILTPDDEGYSLEHSATSGIVHLSDTMEVGKIHFFKDIKDNLNNDLFILKDGYLIKEYDKELDAITFYYYNEKYELVSTIESLSNMQYLYETEEELVFSFYNEILYYDKKNSSLRKSTTLKIEHYNNEFISYMNDTLYTILKEGTLIIYNLDATILAQIDITNYNPTNYYINQNYIGIYSFENKKIYILSIDGKEIKQIDLEDNLEFDKMELQDKKYSILYHKQESDENYKNFYIYETYEESKLLTKNTYHKDYGIHALQEMGLTFDYEMNYNFIIENKVIEVFYTPLNNGTEVFLIYDE